MFLLEVAKNEAHLCKISAKPGFQAFLGRGQAFQANAKAKATLNKRGQNPRNNEIS